jgi:hypothetical protein
MTPRITHTSEIHRSDHPVWQELGGEYVILDQNTGVCYGLDEIGSRVWRLIQTPVTVEAIRDTLVAEYGVDPEVCEQDLLRLLQDLASARLIHVVEGHA